MPQILEGQVAADALNEQLKKNLGPSPNLSLAIILMGDNPASLSYIKSKQKAASKLGVQTTLHHLAAETSQDQLKSLIGQLNSDRSVTGLLVQLPLPEHINPDEIINTIDPHKDVDGLTQENLGRLLSGQPGLVPATARGIIALLQYYNIPIQGRHAVVVGRSILVGKPVSLLLLQEGATVTIAHRQTANLAGITKQADILICAAGQPGLITANHVKPGAVVVDVGLSRTPDGLKGDVSFSDVQNAVSAISPVPGGVGPLTVACLFQNLYQASQLQHPNH